MAARNTASAPSHAPEPMKPQVASPRYITIKRKATDEEKAKLKERMEYERARDRESVRGIFRFHECPGGLMSFWFKKYEKDDVERYDLFDGQVHEIPLGVAKHLNKNCWYPSYSHVPSASILGGNMADPVIQAAGSYIGHEMKVTQKKRRCSFQSLEFIDIDDITPVGVGATDIVTVETM